MADVPWSVILTGLAAFGGSGTVGLLVKALVERRKNTADTTAVLTAAAGTTVETLVAENRRLSERLATVEKRTDGLADAVRDKDAALDRLSSDLEDLAGWTAELVDEVATVTGKRPEPSHRVAEILARVT